MSTSSTHGSPSLIRSPTEQAATSKGLLWTGRVLSILGVLFLLVDAFGKFVKPVPVVDAFVRLGIPLSLATSVGALLLISTVLYAVPRTAVLGAVLLTGYLGGAVAIQLRAASSTFEAVFPVILGVVIWAGLYLRWCGLRRIFPIAR
jgi:DoxX-like family